MHSHIPQIFLRLSLAHLLGMTLYGCGFPERSLSDKVIVGPYRVIRTSAYDAQLLFENQLPAVVDAHISDIGWNSEVIVAIRLPLKRRSPANPKDTYMIPDTDAKEYWVVNHKTNKVSGPFDKSAYERYMKEHSLSLPYIRSVSTATR